MTAAFAGTLTLLRRRCLIIGALDGHGLNDDGLAIIGVRHRRLRLWLLIGLRLLLERLARS